MEVHPSLEAAIKALETKHFHRGKYNPRLGSVEWRNERDDFAIILRNCQGFIIEFTLSAFFTIKLPYQKRGDRPMSNNGGDNDNDSNTNNDNSQSTPQETADKEFAELETIVTENSGIPGVDPDWK